MFEKLQRVLPKGLLPTPKNNSDAAQMGRLLNRSNYIEKVLEPEDPHFQLYSSILREIYEKGLGEKIYIRLFDIFFKSEVHQLQFIENSDIESTVKTAEFKAELTDTQRNFIEKNAEEFQSTNFIEVPLPPGTMFTSMFMFRFEEKDSNDKVIDVTYHSVSLSLNETQREKIGETLLNL